MGCGESKLDSVASGNLTKMFRRKSSRKTPPKDAVEDPTVHQPNPAADKAGESVAPDELRAKDVVNSNENEVASTVVAVRDVKDDDKADAVPEGETSEEKKDPEADAVVPDAASGTPPISESSVGSTDPTVEEAAGPTDPAVAEAKPADEVIGNKEAGEENNVTEDVVVVDDSDQSKPEQEDQPEAEKSENVETEKEELEVSIPAEEESTTEEKKEEVESATKEVETA